MQTSIAKADTRGMSHEEWLATRRLGIGGSDAGAIMGVSKWSTPLSVYLDKLQIAPQKETNEAMRQGTDLEDYVAHRFVQYMHEEEGIDYKVRRCNKVLVHPEYDWMLANIDRDIVGQDAGLECKTASPMVTCDYEAGEIPPQYYYQCLHYMAVTGAAHWYLAVLIYSKGFHVFDIPRDESKIDTMIQAESDFWFNNVIAKVPPLPTSDEADIKAINVLYPSVTDDEIIELKDMDSDFDILQKWKTEKANADKKIAEIEASIKMRLGEHCNGISSGYKVKWSQYDSSSFDKKKMIAEHPELASIVKQYTTMKPQRRFTVTPLKDKKEE